MGAGGGEAEVGREGGSLCAGELVLHSAGERCFRCQGESRDGHAMVQCGIRCLGVKCMPCGAPQSATGGSGWRRGGVNLRAHAKHDKAGENAVLYVRQGQREADCSSGR